MPFSHHSHSGQFCDHAVNTLEEVIQDAISKKLHTFCLTEHIPREQIDFYPEELDRQTEASLIQLFDDYHREATRLRERYKDEINIHIGFEGEWIRPSTLGIIHGLLDRYHFDLFVGSVHHMHTIPIDFDHELYAKAREAAGGTDEKLFRDYFDSQFDMLKALQPPVVGHFDLIRLKSDDPERSFQDFPEVWRKICRNLQFIVEYGGVVELNSASIRKGMSEPYPKREICQEFLRHGGRFTLSDDSHGVEQVALNYAPTIANAARAGIQELSYLTRQTAPDPSQAVAGQRFPHMSWQTISLADASHALQSST